MEKNRQIIVLLETLTGKKSESSPLFDSLQFDGENLNLGLSQFNELLLLLGLDRVNIDFFKYLTNNDGDGVSSIHSIDDLKRGVDKFLKLALLLFGNINFAFKTLSNNSYELQKVIDILKPSDISIFSKRHEPILKIEKIKAEETYYLGYIVQSEIKKRIESHPDDVKAKAEFTRLNRILEFGKRNQEAYLASDHLDVYVATSMRQRHEFLLVSRIADQVFGHDLLKGMNIRYFDPTQAYCEDRIDKGLSEGLMLKRARCTIYLAQESETLGKDSELASTLAQGKPVIAYIPHGTSTYIDELISGLVKLSPEKKSKDIILEQLQIFKPSLAWDNPQILAESEEILLKNLKEIVKDYYNKRAQTLEKIHPLGLQVNLNTGVANGVLVVRTVDDCVRLLKGILTNSLEFDLVEQPMSDGNYWLLNEKLSNCVYRVVTANKSLTNSFWNYYLD